MQLLWLLPTLGYSAIFFAQGGNPWFMIASVSTSVLTVVIRWRVSLRVQPSDATEFRVIDGRAWLDDRRLPRSALLWTKEQNRFVFERYNAMRAGVSESRLSYENGDYEFDEDNLDLLLGFDSQSLVTKNLNRDGPHTVLVGPTGAGKTVLLNGLLASLIRFSKIKLLILDFKGGTGLQAFAAHAEQFETDRDLVAATALLETAAKELYEREVGRLQQGPLLLVVDELAHLLASIPNSIETLSAIAARGRAFGMHLLVTNQNLVGVPRALLSNLRLRILVGDADPVDAAMLGQAASRDGRLAPQVGFGVGRAVAHGTAAQGFYFALPAGGNSPDRITKPKQEPSRSNREHQQHPGSRAHHRASSDQARARHRQHRRRAIPG